MTEPFWERCGCKEATGEFPSVSNCHQAGLCRMRENDRQRGCWVAYYSDWSGAAVFDSELEALRWAVDRQMAVKFVEFGSELR